MKEQQTEFAWGAEPFALVREDRRAQAEAPKCFIDEPDPQKAILSAALHVNEQGKFVCEYCETVTPRDQLTEDGYCPYCAEHHAYMLKHERWLRSPEGQAARAKVCDWLSTELERFDK